jgi:hypothetical protein
MVDRKLKADVKDAQKLVMDAAVSLKKAADRAAKIASSTKDDIRKSKELHEAQASAMAAIKAIEAAAKAASLSIAAGVAGLGQAEEVRKVASKTADVARSGVEVAKTATKAAKNVASRKASKAKDVPAEKP